MPHAALRSWAAAGAHGVAAGEDGRAVDSAAGVVATELDGEMRRTCASLAATSASMSARAAAAAAAGSASVAGSCEGSPGRCGCDTSASALWMVCSCGRLEVEEEREGQREAAAELAPDGSAEGSAEALAEALAEFAADS